MQTVTAKPPHRSIDLGVTGVLVVAGAKRLLGWIVTNQHATLARYLKLYDKATAPTQADTPVMTVVLQPANVAQVVRLGDIGLWCALGIGLRATTGIADNDTGAPSTNDVVVNVFYA